MHREAMAPREAAAAIAAMLTAAGFVARFAGGCVRDELLGHHPADYDVATNATPDQIKAIFPKARGVGEHFGVMLVRQGGRTVEVATFRGEGAYRDGRRPGHVEFSDEVTDANRRDFTINGLFMDPVTGTVIDHVGGRADLQAHVLRAIGDPDARLEEDRLRLLRAVRFAARFEMRMDAATAQAVQRHAPELRGVSRERVGQEVRRMLLHPTRGVAVQLIESLGLAPATLLETGAALQGTRMQRLPQHASVSCALAAWMLDRPMEVPWQQRVRVWTDALVLSNLERDGLHDALSVRESLMTAWSGMRIAARKRAAASTGFEHACALLAAEGSALAKSIQSDLVPLRASGIAPEPLLHGDHLKGMGMQPGPDFRRILDAVYDAQLEGRIDSLQQAEALARQVAAKA